MAQQEIPGLSAAATASNTIRETAKWLITALAAVGAALIAGSQFSNIGKVDSLFSFIAIVGVVVGLVGVGIALWYTIKVLTPGYLGLSTLVKDEDKKFEKFLNSIKESPEVLKEEYINVQALQNKYSESLKIRLSLYDEYQKSVGKATRNEIGLRFKEADDRVVYLSSIVSQVTALANFQLLQEKFIGASKAVFLGGSIAAGGAIIFALGANQPQKAERFLLPSVVEVNLTDDGKTFLIGKIGKDWKDCIQPDQSIIKAVAIHEKDDRWEVVTIPTEACGKPIRFKVTESLGTVLPVGSVKEPPKWRKQLNLRPFPRCWPLFYFG
jgi:hypothetical protein